MSMKAVWYEHQGPASEVLQYGDSDDPRPGTGEVLVQLATSGVNPVDVKRRLGGRGSMTAPRVIPHFDGAGVIDAVGPDVDPRRVGERVWVYRAQWQRDFGTAAELVSVPSECAVALPDSVSFAEGACLGIPAMTAYPAVFADGDVRGQTLLVTGGAGAVGRYAVQFAKLAGARVIATASSDEKAELATSAGADVVVNYRSEEVGPKVLELTGGQGVDRIVEVEFGGNLAASVEVIKTGGVIAAYASQAMSEPVIPFYALMYKSVVIRHVLTFQVPPELERQAVERISGWLDQGELTHHLGPNFSLEETIAAHEAVENGAVGKVVVEVSRTS
jgi:NADPH2:quinone reductase